MSAFHDPQQFAFVARLEAAASVIADELRKLPATAFGPSPDSLTTVADGYDETGWLSMPLAAAGAVLPEAAASCPQTAAALRQVPGLVNACFSRFRPGTRLYPHHGELASVLRCHLGLEVPDGDCALRVGGQVRPWQAGRCLVFDDQVEHDAWNLAGGDRTVLLVTFAANHCV
jgi:beta-hydroxylase